MKSLNLDDPAPQLSFDPFANNIDDKDAVIITVVTNDEKPAEEGDGTLTHRDHQNRRPRFVLPEGLDMSLACGRVRIVGQVPVNRKVDRPQDNFIEYLSVNF
ncbi:MAG: hypothetical protein U0103_11610 [Candidatus Obscuribacterales bacterium]